MISGRNTLKNPIKERDLILLSDYQQELRNRPRLKYLFFELTDRCNLKCRHCGSSCGYDNSHVLDDEVIEKVLISVSSAYEPNNIMICLTGGEPMLFPHIFDVISECKRKGFWVGMTTNGTLVDDDTAKRLVSSGLDTVAVSLDGLKDTHDDLRAVKGSFERAVKGIKSFKKAGLEPQVVTVVHKGNIDQLEAMYKYLVNLEIWSWRLTNVDPIGRASGNDGLLLDAGGLVKLYDFIRSKRFDNDNEMEVTTGCSHFVSMEYEREIRDFYFQCGAGTLVASVAANGDIVACLDIERRQDLVQGNAYNDDFVKVWNDRFEVFRRDRSQNSTYCKDCRNRKICMGDSAHTWNYDLNEPNYCVAKMLEAQ